MSVKNGSLYHIHGLLFADERRGDVLMLIDSSYGIIPYPDPRHAGTGSAVMIKMNGMHSRKSLENEKKYVIWVTESYIIVPYTMQ